jgi:hypothetical protein
LLTGAGFTRNWGGPLVSEVFNYLVATPTLTARVRKMLWDAVDSGGYESVLDKLQLSSAPQDKEDLRVLETALVSMFNKLRYVMQPLDFDFSNDIAHTVTQFLSRFEAIFTVNQDTFLETHYRIPLGGIRSAFGMPGTVPWRPQETPPWLAPAPEPFKQPGPNEQPYYKLHGSAHLWTSGEGMGRTIIVAGGRKKEVINSIPLLKWYQQEFRRYVTRPDCRLMVIGYSFSDPHINALIEEGVRAGTRLFIIDPQGARVLDKRDKRGAIIPLKEPQQELFEAAVFGMSQRLLSSTFGNDVVEWSQVMDFFL